MDTLTLKALLDVASGRKKAELVLKNGQVLNVFTNSWQQADVAVVCGYIAGIGRYEGEEEADLSGKFLVPGFIDTHMHIESSMLPPAELAQEVVPWGTTTMIADPHEVANVSGESGIRYMLDASKNLPCDIYFMLPSCVPATRFEDSGATLGASELIKLAGQERVLGLGEVMDYDGVVSGENGILEKLAAFNGKHKDGHAPLLSGRALEAYRAAGITTDHEAYSEQDVVNKISSGFYILAREGSAAKNLTTLMKAALKHNLPYSRFAFCSDDKHIADIRINGQIRENIKKAIEAGIPAVEAYKMSSFYGASIFGLKELGAVAAGYRADMVVLCDYDQVLVDSVYKSGRLVSRGVKPLKVKTPPPPAFALGSIHIKPVLTADIEMLTSGSGSVIDLVPSQIITRHSICELPCKNGRFVPGGEFLKAVSVERHHASGRLGLGVVRGLGLTGAIATTVGHDSHNILAVGSNDRDILLAIEELALQGGGYTLTLDGSITGRLPLPVFGLMSMSGADEMQRELSGILSAARRQGAPEQFDPLITLSFLSLPVIPEIRLTDRGLFDVLKPGFIDCYRQGG